MEWKQLTSVPLAISQHGMEALGEKLYIVAGACSAIPGNHSNRTYEYDPATNAWTRMDDLAISIQSPAFRAVGNRLYCIGGQNSSLAVTYQDVYEFDPTAATGSQWTQMTDMPTAREDMGSAVVNGKIYIFGGVDPNGAGAFNVLEIYNPTTDTWDETKADLPENKLLGDFGAALNGKIYAIGATNTFAGYPALKPTTAIYEYDPGLDAWATVPAMPWPRCYKEVAALESESKLYIGPGSIINTSTYIDTMYSYEPSTGIWAYKGHAPYAAQGAALAVLNGQVYMSGGYNGAYRAYFYKISNTHSRGATWLHLAGAHEV